MNADDHGYFHGSAQLVASRCFPLQPNARKCEQLLGELTAAELIVRYESGGKQYLALTQWAERSRSKPKYPEPPESLSAQLRGHENNCEQLQTVARLHVHDHVHDHGSAPNGEPISFDAVAGWRGVGSPRLEQWRTAYPAIDVVGEIAKAAAWLRANPKNRKSNYERFLVNWFSRAQDHAPPKGSKPPPGTVVVAM